MIYVKTFQIKRLNFPLFSQYFTMHLFSKLFLLCFLTILGFVFWHCALWGLALAALVASLRKTGSMPYSSWTSTPQLRYCRNYAMSRCKNDSTGFYAPSMARNALPQRPVGALLCGWHNSTVSKLLRKSSIVYGMEPVFLTLWKNQLITTSVIRIPIIIPSCADNKVQIYQV